MKTNFETQTCPRCNGSGSYSFCSDYGDRCFRCGGHKVVLTKRGAAAAAYLEKICSVPASQLKYGDRVLANSVTNGGRVFTYIGTVTDVSQSKHTASCGSVENGKVVVREYTPMAVRIEHAKYGTHSVVCPAESLFRVYGKDNEQKIKQALEYQGTLTVKGTPRKSRKEAL